MLCVNPMCALPVPKKLPGQRGRLAKYCSKECATKSRNKKYFASWYMRPENKVKQITRAKLWKKVNPERVKEWRKNNKDKIATAKQRYENKRNKA